MTGWLHADEAGMGVDQRFLLKLSATREAARVLALDGNAIADRRPKGALAKTDPMPYGVPSVSKQMNGLGPRIWEVTSYFNIYEWGYCNVLFFPFRKNQILVQSCLSEVREEDLQEVRAK